MSGYPCGGDSEPCNRGSLPYFRPNNSVTRGQAAKIDALAFYPLGLAAGAGNLPSTPTPSATMQSAAPAAPPAVPSIPPPVPTTLASPPPCPQPNCGEFSDIEPDNTFFTQIRCLACRNIMSGYPCGTTVGEPCDCSNTPYFRPSIGITRQQMAKIVSDAAGFTEDPGSQVFEDMTPDLPLYPYVQRLAHRSIIGGYPCTTGLKDHCFPPDNRPYFHPVNFVSRGEGAKIVSNTAGYSEAHTEWTYQDVPPNTDIDFYIYIQRLSSRDIVSGYPCGGVNPQTGEALPCGIEPRPYYLSGNFMTRGQAAKVVSDTFFLGCQNPPPPGPQQGEHAPSVGTGTASVPPQPSASVSVTAITSPSPSMPVPTVSPIVSPAVSPSVSASVPPIGSPSPARTTSPSVVPTGTVQTTATEPVPPAQPSVPPSIPSPISTTAVQLPPASPRK